MYIPEKIRIVWHADDKQFRQEITSADAGHEGEPVSYSRLTITLGASGSLEVTVRYFRDMGEREQFYNVEYTKDSVILDIQHNT